MEGIKFENINEKKDEEETIEKEKNLESIENIKNFVGEEKELLTKSSEKGEKESRIKTTIRKITIGTTIMISLWSMGKMDSNKVEASRLDTHTEERDNLENLKGQSASFEDTLRTARKVLGTEHEKFVIDDEEYTRREIAEIIEDTETKKRKIDEEIENLSGKMASKEAKTQKSNMQTKQEDVHREPQKTEARNLIDEKKELLNELMDNEHLLNDMI